LRLHNQLYDQSERYRRLSVSVAPKKRNIGDEHQKIMDAVLARDANKAVKAAGPASRRTTAILLDADWTNCRRSGAQRPARRVAR